MMKVSFSSSMPQHGVLCLGVHQDRQLTPKGQALDQQTQGHLQRALKASHFQGKKKETLCLLAPGNTEFDRVVLFGLGKGPLNEEAACDVGGSLVAHLHKTPHTHAFVMGDDLDSETLIHVATGALLRSWRFHKYRTNLKPHEKPALEEIVFYTRDPAAAQSQFAQAVAVAEGVFWARELVSEPGNVLYPQTLAQQAETLKDLGVTVEVFDEVALKKMGMEALLGVGCGSDKPPRLVVMQWKGGGATEKPLAFVGKGVTFDSGGISLKPAANMDEMKGDMGGSAVVLGLMRSLALGKVPVHAVGVVALAENMPSGNAQRPGDIVKSLSGQTIEVLNTDAEGRLILADALWYTQDRFQPRYMVDLATLTGAIRVALGTEYAGLFSSDDELVSQLTEAGQQVGEKVWRLPLDPAYDEAVTGTISDIKNITAPGVGAGSITAAQFLARFVNNVPWAHLDIAGVEDAKKDSALCPAGATGFGVRLLRRWVQRYAA